ncbi:AGL073W-Cp [Eremothecium gossypii ATCC 10895]|uniref:AGL073W-Cp n=1 Tax=Eremothecium gossypii (strain ATCC 10895 / CBS 109.51 / FGSC 9923 / NRRL Y-1056) TaxID=284811 RepID=D8FGG0_EREGS|nr:AGL073W-Cp [Eremothecium gossypii ATCC 10895]ADJ41737.1 AGL073W-Cp [Eremothecium gossypii ATCC 10895]AEY98746.1 FAGL073W-Cp [Eremothecium gossypii FDAG1]
MDKDSEASQRRKLLSPFRQPGCSTLPPPVAAPSSSPRVPARSKVALKPGHSALDWHALSESAGARGRFVHGLEPGLPWWDHFCELQHPAALHQLERGVPPHRILPPLRIDAAVLKACAASYWCVLRGRVYCITDYLDFHPGGVAILAGSCKGRDVTKLFERYHRWVNFERLLECCQVGVYV